jgi:hypothetical protein
MTLLCMMKFDTVNGLLCCSTRLKSGKSLMLDIMPPWPMSPGNFGGIGAKSSLQVLCDSSGAKKTVI